MLNSTGTYNSTIFKHTFNIDECDHSNIELKINPQYEGNFNLHVLIGNCELLYSPQPITITKSEKHLQYENEELLKKELLKKAKDAKLQDLKNKEQEKLKLQRAKEEQLKKRREETEKRAKEAVLKAKDAALAEQKAREEERKWRKENRCGGGFKMPAKK